MKVIILMILFVSHSVQAEGPKLQKWMIGTTEITVVESPWGGLINPSCLDKKDCQALAAVKDKQKGIFSSSGGKNPASAVCQSHHHAKVVMSTHGGRTQAFCVFADSSLVSLDGIAK